MTTTQIRNVTRHFGLGRWSKAYAKLMRGERSRNPAFGRLIRRGPGAECLTMLRAVISAEYIREYWDFRPDVMRKLDEALAIANG